jgi:hypothetical protein
MVAETLFLRTRNPANFGVQPGAHVRNFDGGKLVNDEEYFVLACDIPSACGASAAMWTSSINLEICANGRDERAAI